MPKESISWLQRLDTYWYGPVPAWPLAGFRILFAIALLAYFTDRIFHLEEFLGASPGRLPDLGATGDSPLRFHQPLYVEPLTRPMQVAAVGVFYLLGVSLLVGFRAQLAAGFLAGWVASVTLVDWMGGLRLQSLFRCDLGDDGMHALGYSLVGGCLSCMAPSSWARGCFAESAAGDRSSNLGMAHTNSAVVPFVVVRACRAGQAQGTLVSIRRQRRPLVSTSRVVSERFVLVGDHTHSKALFRSGRNRDGLLRVVRPAVVAATAFETLGHVGGDVFTCRHCGVDDEAMDLQRGNAIVLRFVPPADSG